MVKSIEDKLEFLKKLLEDKSELEHRHKLLKEEIQQTKFDLKDSPKLKKELAELKGKSDEVKKDLKHTSKQVKWFAAQIGQINQSKTGYMIVALIAFLIGGMIGYFVFSGGVVLPIGSDSEVDNLVICEFVYNGQPAGLGPNFEIGQSKELHCYTEVSPRTTRTDFYVEWIHKGQVKDTTPLPVTKEGGPVWAKREFSLDDLGDWEAHLKTRDGNTWGITNFKLTYPQIEIKEALICEDILDGKPRLIGDRFLAKDITLYCFTSTKTKEKYTEIFHEWFHESILIAKEKIQLDNLQSSKWSRQNVKANQIGAWHVNIVTGDDKILKRLDFEIQNQNTIIPSIILAANIVDNKPDSALTRFVANGEDVYCYTRAASNFPNFKIRHIWKFNRKKMFEKTFNIDSTSAEVYSSFEFPLKYAGAWTIDIVDVNGVVLASKDFSVEKPITEQVKINQLVFCRTVFQKDPYDIASKFKVDYNTKIWAHATVNSKKARTNITYKWYYNGALIKSNTIDNISRSTSYRTYDYKTVVPGQKGEWNVNVYAEDGTLLKRGKFIVE